MNTEEFAAALEDILDDLDPERDVLYDDVTRVRSFEQAGVLTTDQGCVVTMRGGTEFHVTVVRSK